MANIKAYQVQLTAIDENGDETKVYPKNTGPDVGVGQLSSGGLILPGSNKNETLDVTLANIRKYLSNLNNIAQTFREVSQNSKDTSAANIPSTAVTSGLQTAIDDLVTEVNNIKTHAAGLAPKMHAATDLTYGGATGTKYGHVKLSDTYATSEANSAAANSVGASQNALYNAWNNLNSGKAPNNHAVNAATYGKGSSTLYGHVRVSDTYTTSSNDAAEAATRRALYNAYTALKRTDDTQQTAIDGKAPKSHASSANTYGLGSTGNYGHLKISDAYDQDNSRTGAAANAVAASSWSVYRAYSSLSGVVNDKLAKSHANEKATASAFSHVKLTDTYNSSQGAASAGIAPSSLALYNAYNSLSASITSLQNSVDTLNNKTIKFIAEIGTLTTTNQFVGRGVYKVNEISSELVNTMALDDNPGDYDAFVICYNGDGSHFNFGVFMLCSPRYNEKFYIVQVWEGRPHAACITNNVNLSGYATQDWVNSNFSNVKATLVGSNLGKMLSLSSGDSLSTILTKVGDGESLYGRFNAALKFLYAHTPEWGGYLDKVKIVKRNTTYTISLGADEGRWENHYTYHPFHNRFLRTNRSVLDWVYPDNYGFAQSGGMACGNAYPLNSHPTAQFTPNNAGVWILWLAGNPTGDNIVSNYSLIICIG